MTQRQSEGESIKWNPPPTQNEKGISILTRLEKGKIIPQGLRIFMGNNSSQLVLFRTKEFSIPVPLFKKMSESNSPQGKNTNTPPNTTSATIHSSRSGSNNIQSNTRSPNPYIFLNNLNISSSNRSSLNRTSNSSIPIGSSASSGNLANNIKQNNPVETHSGTNLLTVPGASALGLGPPPPIPTSPPREVKFSSSRSRHNLQRMRNVSISQDVEIDIDDNDNDSVGGADDLRESLETHNLLFRIGPGSGTSDTLKIPTGIFSNRRRIFSTDNLLDGEMSEEKLLKALEDDEARDEMPSPTSRWRKTSESNGLNRNLTNLSPRPPLRSTKSSSALLGQRPQTTLGMITANNNSLWMSHECDDYLKHECDEKCSSLLHMAVKTGNLDEVEIQLETGGDPNSRDCFGRTPLHYAVTMGCNCDSCIATAARCTQLLVDSSKTDIDSQDNQGETALHLAAENQATKCASILLYSAADVSIKSKAGVKALTLIVEKIPDALDSLLNRAVSIEKYDPTNVKCELKLDFGALVGYSETRGYSQRKGKLGATNGESNGNVKARKEMQLLTLILDCSSSARKKILTHPLIAIFLYLKWRCVRTVFWLTILLHVVLLMLYTLYILDVYLISCPYRPKITEPAAVKAAKAEGNYLQSENSTYRAEFIKFSWFEFSPQLQELGTIKSNLYDGCPLEIGPTVKSVLLLALTILMVTNEVFKMLPAPRSYLRRTNNRLQWTLFLFIFLTSWPVFMSHPNINFWQYQAAAFGLFLAWGLMLSQIGKFPILGLYVEILTKVLKNFGFFMVTYASLLMAFALAFCVLFPGNAPYSSIPLAILKVLMMMVGEVNYEDLFYGNEENPVDDLLYPITGHFLYGAFVIMITIVLMNLLVGLTVSDIQGLQKDAELTRLSRQIGEISQLESFVFSKRVQSFLPSSFAAFLRESVLVVRPKYDDKSPTNPTSPKDFKESGTYFHLRPNDPNDKSIPEDLKVAVLRIAAARHRTKRTNRCTKNFHRGATAPSTPLLEEYQRYATAHSGASGWLPPPYQRIYSRGTHPTIPGSGTQAGVPAGPPPGPVPVIPPPWSQSTAGNRPRMGSAGANALRDPPEYTYFMKRLEEKIMDRMKIQMDTLYQKIEDKMMNIH